MLRRVAGSDGMRGKANDRLLPAPYQPDGRFSRIRLSEFLSLPDVSIGQMPALPKKRWRQARIRNSFPPDAPPRQILPRVSPRSRGARDGGARD